MFSVHVTYTGEDWKAALTAGATCGPVEARAVTPQGALRSLALAWDLAERQSRQVPIFIQRCPRSNVDG